MADLDDLREGSNFGLGVVSSNNNFHVKGAENLPWGYERSLVAYLQPENRPYSDAGIRSRLYYGPTSGLERIDLNIVPLIEYADCLMCTRGSPHNDTSHNKQTHLSPFRCGHFHPDRTE